MKKKIMVFMMICIYSTVLVFAGSAKGKDAIVGKWMVEEKDCLVEIYEKDGKFYGKIVWLKDAYDDNGELTKDSENPDPALKERSILGMEFIYGFTYKNETWEKGRIYSPRNGKTYYCKITLTDDGKLKLRGSLDKMGMLGKTETWTREK